jgi:mRNA interferase MazF
MRRSEVVLVDLEPTIGAEMNKTRPCLIISPDEMNDVLRTVQIAPITSVERELPTRVFIKASRGSGLDKDSYVVLDQLKTIDKKRVMRSIGKISDDELEEVCDALCQMYAY